METTITISTIFNAPAEKIWPRLVQVETLRKIAKPYAYFKPLDDMSEWNQNDTYRLKLSVF
jgi:ligand-binding SRPBCC domain-containing protein